MPTISKTMQLDRVSRLLTLGETISRMSNRADPWGDQVQEEPGQLLERVGIITKELRRLYPQDPAFQSLRSILGTGSKQISEECLWILALVSYSSSNHCRQHETADTIAQRSYRLFSDHKVTGMLLARQVIGDLIRRRVIELSGDALIVNAAMRYWLAGDNPYAHFGINEQEAQHYLQSDKRRKSAQSTDIKARIKAIPLLTPEECFNEIGKHGYIGQDEARKAISLAAYRHVKRLRSIHLDRISSDELPPRENALLLGSTGSGKSLIIQTLFQHILKLPTAISDATSLSETGYVGENVESLLHRLLINADGQKDWAQCGISAIDEFDKIASTGGSSCDFGGGSRSLEVSRTGVQRGLLKLFEENSSVDISAIHGVPISRGKISFNTSQVLFIACGAFSGLESITSPKAGIGFREQGESHDGQHDVLNEIQALTRYGFARELLGRFGLFVRFNPLSIDDLISILERNTIRRYARELSQSGIELTIDDQVKQVVVNRAMERGTGARGLASELMAILNDACFSAYSSAKPVKSVRLFHDGDSVQWDITHSISKPPKHIKNVKPAKNIRYHDLGEVQA